MQLRNGKIEAGRRAEHLGALQAVPMRATASRPARKRANQDWAARGSPPWADVLRRARGELRPPAASKENRGSRRTMVPNTARIR